MSEGLSFARRGRRPQRSAAPLLALLLLTGLLALVLRPLASSSDADDDQQAVLIEVTGDVPSPGLYEVAGASAAEALRLAGRPLPTDITTVPEGHVLNVQGDHVRLLSPADPLVVGLPIDLNQAAVHELMAVPGIGAGAAGAIVTERAEGGPFTHVGDLQRVAGIGPSTVERLRPFVTVPGGQPPPVGPVDINRATAAELERLPGIGPVTAARIVVDRDERGPYADLTDLQRVKGIGPATVAGLADQAVAESP